MSELFSKCRISALTLAKIAKHSSKNANEVMGLLLGHTEGNTFVLSDCFMLPVNATETNVNALGLSYEYIVEYLNSLNLNYNIRKQVVGWYHSHPNFGCFLSKIDIQTQKQNQKFQDPFVAVVFDPVRSLENENVEIGAFRVYGEEVVELEVEFYTGEFDSLFVSAFD